MWWNQYCIEMKWEIESSSFLWKERKKERCGVFSPDRTQMEYGTEPCHTYCKTSAHNI